MTTFDNTTKIYLCGCYKEGLVIEKDQDFEEVYFSIFDRGLYSNNKLNWRQKLRYCWHIITIGEPYLDEIILNKETAEHLAKDILEMLKEK